MNATTVIAAEKLAQVIDAVSAVDSVAAAALAEVLAMLEKEIEEFEAHLCAQYDPDVPHMYVSAGWGWD